jgi:hypothetical protein
MHFYVPLADIALGNFVNALLQVEPGKNLLGYASMLSWNEYAALWGKIHGVTCRFQPLDRTVLENAVPGGVGEELADMFGYIGEFGYDGRDPTVVHPKDVGLSATFISRTLSYVQYSSVCPSRSIRPRSISRRKTGLKSFRLKQSVDR